MFDEVPCCSMFFVVVCFLLLFDGLSFFFHIWSTHCSKNGFKAYCKVYLTLLNQS